MGEEVVRLNKGPVRVSLRNLVSPLGLKGQTFAS